MRPAGVSQLQLGVSGPAETWCSLCMTDWKMMARSGRMESNLTLGNRCLVTMALESFAWVKRVPGNRRLLIKPDKAEAHPCDHAPWPVTCLVWCLQRIVSVDREASQETHV